MDKLGSIFFLGCRATFTGLRNVIGSAHSLNYPSVIAGARGPIEVHLLRQVLGLRLKSIRFLGHPTELEKGAMQILR
jgi:hypothetical protein